MESLFDVQEQTPMSMTPPPPPPENFATAAQETTLPANVEKRTDIASTTLLLRVRFGMLGNSRKIDPSAITVDADKELIKASKTLLDSPELKAIRDRDNEILRQVKAKCLPGFDEGLYFLPLQNYKIVNPILKAYQEERPSLVAVFMEAYPRLCLRAEERLKSVWNPRDYPSARAVEERFTFEYLYLEIGPANNLKLISQEDFDREKAKMVGVMQNAAEMAGQAQAELFMKLITRLQERLTDETNGKQKTFRDSTIENLQEFISGFDVMNCANFDDLKAIVDRARGLLKIKPQALRDFDGLRVEVRKQADVLVEQVSALVINKPSRKFRFEE